MLTISTRAGRLARGLAAAAVVAAAGCSGDPFRAIPIDGKLVAADGSPVSADGYTVSFRTEVADKVTGKTKFMTSTGVVQPGGTFKLSTYKYGDGVVAGTHAVSIYFIGGVPNAQVQTEGSTTPVAPAQARVQLPAKYQVAETSGLTATVTTDTRDIVLSIETITPKKK